MQRETPFELDPEFDVLPYEYRRGATDLKFLYGLRREAADRSRHLRNEIGKASILAYSGVAVAHYAGHINLDHPAGLGLGVSFGLGLLSGTFSVMHKRAKREDETASIHAGIVANMFKRSELEPPAWTQELQPNQNV